jgi:hypothetical protein
MRRAAHREPSEKLLEDNQEAALVFRGEAAGRTNGNVCRAGGFGSRCSTVLALEFGADTCEVLADLTP